MGKTKRYTKADLIEDLLEALNEHREKNGLIKVRKGWTGAGHWLMTDEKEYKNIGNIYTSDEGFIGFLEGLLINQ